VTSEQRGRYTYYRLADERIDSLLRLAEEVLSDVAQGVYQIGKA
jgi:DNA-binding transcriptional ArsR family regulator